MLDAPRGRLQAMNAFLARSSDVLLALGVFAVVAMMIVPVPKPVMDFMLATNMTVATLILVTALYLRDAARFPSFPTILLLTTMFRLALNVSTTRLILSEGDAGELIRAFGEFVVAGNTVVGAVVFLVLVVVQFVVIAKGSERVAEVSARFTLDAMQGKQMSIDRDANQGVIAPEEARRRRQALDRESKLYGAMDGAMKFVKGDAIAGIIISLVNIVGGLVIGVAQEGYGLADAAQTYSLLTIGDGLVSQIPSLLISVAAGIVITRVAAGDEDEGHLAGDLLRQFVAHRKALLLAGLLALAIGASHELTGFPLVPFLVLGGVLLGLSIPGLWREARARRRGEVVGAGGDGAGDGEATDDVNASRRPLRIAPPAALELVVGDVVRAELVGPGGHGAPAAVEADLQQVRVGLAARYGLPVPAIELVDHRLTVPPSGYAIMLRGAAVATGDVHPGRGLALCTTVDAATHGVEAEPAIQSWSGFEACLVRPADSVTLEAAGITVMTPAQAVQHHLVRALQHHAADLLGVQEVADLLDQMRETHEALVDAVVPKPLNTAQLADVLRAFLNEGIPISDLRGILESIAVQAAHVRSIPELIDAVRRDQRRAICAAYQSRLGRLSYAALGPRAEAMLDEAIMTAGGAGATPRLGADEQRALASGAYRAFAAPSAASLREQVILVRPEHRRPLRTLLADYLPHVRVMSWPEIAPEFKPVQVGLVEPAIDAEAEAEAA